MKCKIELVRKIVDNGWPDEGHYEWFLVRLTTRTNGIMQSLFGDREENLVGFGEDKPSDESVNKAMERYSMSGKIVVI